MREKKLFCLHLVNTGHLCFCVFYTSLGGAGVAPSSQSILYTNFNKTNVILFCEYRLKMRLGHAHLQRLVREYPGQSKDSSLDRDRPVMATRNTEPAWGEIMF